MSFKRCLEHIAIIILRHFKFVMFMSMSGPGCQINMSCFGKCACLGYLLSRLGRGVGGGGGVDGCGVVSVRPLCGCGDWGEAVLFCLL